MKRKTQDEYVKELRERNPNVILIGNYVSCNKNTMHKCLIHNIEWETTPSRALHGCGCPKCKLDRHRKSASKTTEEYCNELNEVNPHIVVKGEYVSARVPIKHYCTIHKIEWNASPNNVLRSNGCKKCGFEKIQEKNSKTHEKYVEELKQITTTIIPKEQYIDALTPILHECLIDHYQWKTTPANLLSRGNCPKCTHHVSINSDIYKERLEQKNPHIEQLESFIDKNTPILHLCKKHNVKWKIAPVSALRGVGCCQCIKEATKPRKTHDQYVSELKRVNPNIVPIEKYQYANIPILHKCLIDDYIWKASPANLLYGTSCPRCNSSHGERIIELWLSSIGMNYERQKKFDECKDIFSLPFDFYVYDKNTCIEYDGEQHFRPVEFYGGESSFQKLKRHDQIKSDFCKENNINLLRIAYNENIEEKLNNYFIHLI